MLYRPFFFNMVNVDIDRFSSPKFFLMDHPPFYENSCSQNSFYLFCYA